MIIEKKYFFTVIFLSLLISFIVIFTPFKCQKSFEGKELEWIDKPSFVLLKNLESENPVLRREAIIKLGEKRVEKALKPLFDILTSKTQPLYEKQLAAKSIALISSSKIIPIILKAIEYYNSLPPDTVNKNIIIGMLYVLNNIDSSQLNIQEYDFSILDTIISKNKDNDILKVTIEAIGNLGYIKPFYTISTLYSNLFLKLSCIDAMRKLSLKEPKLALWYLNFINKSYFEETNSSVKAAINKSIIMLEKRELTQKDLYLIEKITLLSSNNIIESTEGEEFLIKSEIKEENKYILKFFLTSKDYVLKNRLLEVMKKKGSTFGLEDYLYTIIDETYTVKPIEIGIDSSKKALSLFQYSEEVIDIGFIAKLIYNYHLSVDAIKLLSNLIEKKVYTERIKEIFTPYNYSLFQAKQNLIPLLEIYLKLGLDRNINNILLSGDPYLTRNTILFLKSKNITENYKETINKIINNDINRKILEI
ncbi:MAG TPA: HEAT repeat domain-containing protein [Spirochaetota bacterium]|nr:HEAT repeat domain-containing protein [Spirochaetota bacterium]HOM38664.1 HEAT repeat domain-containing protein [Spirochaetota bacterium]HPQ49820.1 HEAT repeat domain-containing protein [Spirochaetota bacterium]